MFGKHGPATGRSFGTLVAVLILSTVLAACSTPAPLPVAQPLATAPPGSETPAASAPVEGPTAAATPARSSGPKVLTMARISEPFSVFIPWQIDDNPTVFLSVNVYDSLLRVSPDGARFEPALAVDWKTADDGLSWTFTLRSGVKFSDGKPLTAEDVKASLDAARSSEKSYWSSIYAPVTDVEVVDPRTVRINLTGPFAPLPSVIALFSSAILPADLVQASESSDFDPAIAWQTRGTGAYMIEEWHKGDEIVLRANPNYWKGRPAVDEVHIEYVPDDLARVDKLRRGEVDVIDFLPLGRLQELDEMPGVTAKPFTLAQMTFVMLNNAKKPLDDVKVRQALNYATDKEAINTAVYFGHARVANAPIPPGMYQATDLPGYPYNPEKARQLLAESSAPNGFELEMQVRSGNTEFADVAALLKEQWAQVGVNVKIVNLETSAVRTNYREGNYQAMPNGWTNDMNDPSLVVNAGMRGGEGTQFALWTRYYNPELNAMIDRADLELDPARRGEMYHEIQRIFQEAAPVIWLGYTPATAGFQDYVEGFTIETLGYYRFENVKLNK